MSGIGQGLTCGSLWSLFYVCNLEWFLPLLGTVQDKLGNIPSGRGSGEEGRILGGLDCQGVSHAAFYGFEFTVILWL